MKKVYIVLVNYNAWQDTIECLESLLKLKYPNYQIIVVDNQSKNHSMNNFIDWADGNKQVRATNRQLAHLSTHYDVETIDYLLYDEVTAVSGGIYDDESTLDSPILFVQADQNNGFAYGCNIGIKYALAREDAEYVWCLNSDTVVEADTLDFLVGKDRQYRDLGKKVGIIGAKLMYYHHPDLIQGVGGYYNKWLSKSNHIGAFENDHGQYDNEDVLLKVSNPIGASMFVSNDFIKSVGLMCEDYFLYFEELDWVMRGKEKGWACGYCWEAKIFHKEGGSIGTNTNLSQRSEVSQVSAVSSRVLFVKKYFRYFLPLTVSLLVLYTLLTFIRGNRDNCLPMLRALKCEILR